MTCGGNLQEKKSILFHEGQWKLQSDYSVSHYDFEILEVEEKGGGHTTISEWGVWPTSLPA